MILWLAACSAPPPLDPALVREALEVSARVDRERTWRSVEALHAVQVADPGEWNERFEMPHKREAATPWLVAAFAAQGVVAVVEPSSEDGIDVQNVVVELPGLLRPDEIVLVTAHHDAWYGGADDNATGVAALVELARLLADHPLDRTVRLVSFDQEEVAMVGSRRYYRDHADDGLVAAWNLDSIGYASSAPGSQASPLGFVMPDTADFALVVVDHPGAHLASWAAQLASRLPDPVGLGAAIGPGDNDWPATESFHRSDQSSAWLLGLPAGFQTDTPDLRNPNYHSAADTPETLDRRFFTSNVQLAAAMATVLQGAP